MRPQRFHFKPPVNLNPYKQFTRLSLGESTRNTVRILCRGLLVIQDSSVISIRS